MSIAIFGDFIDDILRGRGVNEIGCSDFYGRCSSNKELQRIASVHYPSEANHRYFDSLGGLPNHPHCNRTYAWTGKAACNRTQYGTPAFYIDGHSKERVDQLD